VNPTLTVVVLLVLWLIVVVPMIVRRSDDRAPERSVRGFGRAMRALNRRHADPHRSLSVTDDDASYVRPRIAGPRDEVFVVGADRHPGARGSKNVAVRRPVPAAQEALMYPVDHSELSAPRQQMMSRRRRSLSILGGGSMLLLVLAVMLGGALVWALTLLFSAALGGYVYFLRTQALRDRERREHRQQRATARRTRSYDVTESEEYFAEPPASVVRIDDDDVTLHNLDTVDLTGLYNEQATDAPEAQRRAS